MNVIHGKFQQTLRAAIMCAAVLRCGSPMAGADVLSDGDVRITDLQPWRGYFAGRDAGFRFAVSARRPVQGLIVWRFAVMDATMARGEQALALDATQPLTVDIPLQFPEARPGIIVDAVLEVGILDDARKQTRATYRKAIRLYPDNPFFEQTERLQQQRIHLFDPENTLVERMEELGVPLTLLPNLRALRPQRDGILIVGANVSFLDYRGLFAEMAEAASRGVKVLCLTPAGGEIELPGMGGSELPRPRSVRFHGVEIIHSYDKKFDALSWPLDGRIASAGITLEGVRGLVVGQVGNQADGWPWIEFEYASGGRLILCGFAVTEQWDAGPMPRFLLFEIINELSHRSQPRRASSRPAN